MATRNGIQGNWFRRKNGSQIRGGRKILMDFINYDKQHTKFRNLKNKVSY